MNGVTQISVTEDIALITFSKVPNDLKTIAGIFEAVANAGINIDMVSQTTPRGQFVSFSFTVCAEDTVKVLALVNSIKNHAGGIRPMVSTGNCKIQLYGEEMPRMHGVFSKVMAAVAATEAELNLITTSEVDVSLLLSPVHMEDAIAALEKQFGVTADRPAFL